MTCYRKIFFIHFIYALTYSVIIILRSSRRSATSHSIIARFLKVFFPSRYAECHILWLVGSQTAMSISIFDWNRLHDIRVLLNICRPISAPLALFISHSFGTYCAYCHWWITDYVFLHPAVFLLLYLKPTVHILFLISAPYALFALWFCFVYHSACCLFECTFLIFYQLVYLFFF